MLADLDETKTLDELDFHHIPIWIRVSQLPLGLMNADVAEVIGNEIGAFLDVDTDDGSRAVGRFLRVKVRIDIRKPLMRGVTVIADDDGAERWCPVAYEHLPDFCYLCGLLGHMDRLCSHRWVKGKPLPYDRSLRCLPPKKKGIMEGGGRGASNSMLPWRTNPRGSGSRGSLSGSMGKPVDDKRSYSLSWKKDEAPSDEKNAGHAAGEDEATSPLNCLVIVPNKNGGDGIKKNLLSSLSTPVGADGSAQGESGTFVDAEMGYLKEQQEKKKKWKRAEKRRDEIPKGAWVLAQNH